MSVIAGPLSYEEVAKKGSAPWSGFVYIVDANGKKIATLLGSAEQKQAMAQLIIDASNCLYRPIVTVDPKPVNFDDANALQQGLGNAALNKIQGQI